MAKYVVMNYNSLKVMGHHDTFTDARKRVYKELKLHPRSQFAVSRDDDGYGFGEIIDGEPIYQLYKKGVYMGAYRLYSNGNIRM